MLERTASDEASRRHAARMYAELSSPEFVAAARQAAKWQRRRIVLRFHDYIIPVWWPLSGCILCVFMLIANVYGVVTGSQPVYTLKYAMLFATIAAGCYLVTRLRRFSVISDGFEITCRAIGRRHAHLRTGTIQCKELRDVKERTGDKVLEVYGQSGLALEIPMQVEGYDGLHKLLRNLSGIRGGKVMPAGTRGSGS